MDVFLQAEFAVLDFIAAHFSCAFLDTIMPMITRLGDRGLIWILLGLALFLIPGRSENRKIGIQILIALLLSVISCNLLLKNIVARIRPCDLNTAVTLLIARPLDFSFPSGHTAASFASIAVLFKNHWKGRCVALILALMIAFSRLYLYVHFPTDVLAGVVLGLALGLLSWFLYEGAAKRMRFRRFKNLRRK
ncbi:MAG: phosphatase PAP2 family protein [Evtepia sp.]